MKRIMRNQTLQQLGIVALLFLVGGIVILCAGQSIAQVEPVQKPTATPYPPTITYCITLSGSEAKAFYSVANTTLLWIENAIHERARKAVDYQVSRAMRDTTGEILSDVDRLTIQNVLEQQGYLVAPDAEYIPLDIKYMIIDFANLE